MLRILFNRDESKVFTDYPPWSETIKEPSSHAHHKLSLGNEHKPARPTSLFSGEQNGELPSSPVSPLRRDSNILYGHDKTPSVSEVI